MSITKDSILSFKGKPLTPVETPEWGGTVYLRVMRGSERDAFEAETYKLNGKSLELNRVNARARLLVKTLCDEQGNRLFTDADATQLGEQPADVLDRVYTVALRVNGFTSADVADLAKNS
jgi:hypothetical protein